MRSYENNNKAGDMFVTFRVEFPDGKMSDADAQGEHVAECKILNDVYIDELKCTALGSMLPGGDKTVVFNGLESRFVPTERLSSM